MIKPFYQDSHILLYCGNVFDVLPELPPDIVQTCVTSPPYYGLRDYGVEPSIWGGDSNHAHEWVEQITPAANGLVNNVMQGETLSDTSATRRPRAHGFCECGAWLGSYGLEPTPQLYIEHTVLIFNEIRRVLKKDGTVWLNLGDSYAGSGKGGQSEEKRSENWQPTYPKTGETARVAAKTKFAGEPRTSGTFKPKDLMMIPHRVVIALQDAGWWVRQDIVWSKPNPMPESVTDRCTKSHEYIFLLTKSQKYYFDQDSIREPLKDASIARLGQNIDAQEGSNRVPGKTNGNMKAVVFGGNDRWPDTRLQSGKEWMPSRSTANKKSVWTITTKPFKSAHFATFPPEIPETCIKAGSRENDIVLDPFAGAGTTGVVAKKLGRKSILIELNPKYCEMIVERIKKETSSPLFDGQGAFYGP